MVMKVRSEFDVNITDADIVTIIKMAVPGIKRWCNQIKCNIEEEPAFDSEFDNQTDLGIFMGETVVKSEKLLLYNQKKKRYYALTHRKIIDGIKKYLEKPIANDFLEFSGHELWVKDPDLIDKATADAIVQYGLFGKIMYR